MSSMAVNIDLTIEPEQNELHDSQFIVPFDILYTKIVEVAVDQDGSKPDTVATASNKEDFTKNSIQDTLRFSLDKRFKFKTIFRNVSDNSTLRLNFLRADGRAAVETTVELHKPDGDADGPPDWPKISVQVKLTPGDITLLTASTNRSTTVLPNIKRPARFMSLFPQVPPIKFAEAQLVVVPLKFEGISSSEGSSHSLGTPTDHQATREGFRVEDSKPVDNSTGRGSQIQEGDSDRSISKASEVQDTPKALEPERAETAGIHEGDQQNKGESQEESGEEQESENEKEKSAQEEAERKTKEAEGKKTPDGDSSKDSQDGDGNQAQGEEKLKSPGETDPTVKDLSLRNIGDNDGDSIGKPVPREVLGAMNSTEKPSLIPETKITTERHIPQILIESSKAKDRPIHSWQKLGFGTFFGGREKPSTLSKHIDSEIPAEILGLDWELIRIAVDGKFTAAFIPGEWDAWAWMLSGDSLSGPILGIVCENLNQSVDKVRSIFLPARPKQVKEPSSSAKTDSSVNDRFMRGSEKQRPPTVVSEAELAANPNMFTEDPGAFCKPFSNPQRILSERSFYSVLRTEQPNISAQASVRLSEPAQLDFDPPDEMLEALWEQEGSTTTRALLAAQPRSRLPSGAILTPDALKPPIIPTKVFRDSIRDRLEVFLDKTPPRLVDRWSTLNRERVEVSALNPVQWDSESLRYQAVTVARGHILEFRIRTRSNGYSLGDVASTLTLAPRQTKRKSTDPQYPCS